MENIVRIIEKTIADHELVKTGDKILVAFSGGPDSAALLSILNILQETLGVDIGAAHLNHKIRKSSVQDLNFCKIFCSRVNIKFHHKSLNIPRLASLRRKSLEETGRDERYRFFDTIAGKFGYSKIATGHNLDDKAETIFFNIMRGAGLGGVRGIPIRRGKIIRPLINVGKKDITAWLKENKVKYIRDSSNSSNRFSRNRIRNQIFPLIERINAGFKGNLIRLSAIADEEFEIGERIAEIILERAILKRSKSKIILDLGVLEQYHKSLIKKAMSVAFQGVGAKKLKLSSNEFEQVMDLLRAKSGSKILLDGEAMLQKSQGRLAITLQKDHTKGSVSDLRRLKIPGNTEIPNCEKWIESKILSAQRPKNLKSTPEMAFLDYDKISRPHIRTRKDGDRIRPYGMSGRKLISDVLIERKIPQFERNQIPIVVSGNKIAWIAGVMIADDFKVTESTKSILNLKLCER